MVKKKSPESGNIVYAGPMIHQYLIPASGITNPARPWEILPAGEMEYYSHCAFYFAKCANLALLEIPEQVSLEGEVDLTIHLRPLLDSCMQIYGLFDVPDDIEKVMKIIPLVRRIAFMRNLAWNNRLDAWCATGGKAYNEVTRDPEALNKS